MDVKNTQLEDFTCSLTEQDLRDIKDIIEISKVCWNRKEKRTVTHFEPLGLRLYTTYNPNGSSNVNHASISAADYFPLQPSFYRCCASTGNIKIYNIFENLVHRSIAHYNKSFSMVAGILTDCTIAPHIHYIDPTKNVTTTTYYWTLTNDQIDCDFLYNGEKFPLYKQGYLEFNPAVPHGAGCQDTNMRFFVIIDSD